MQNDERQWRVNMDRELLEAFAADLESRGMTQRAGTERLIRAFMSFDEDIRGLLLQVLTPERTAALARLILREMGKGKRSG